MLTDRVTICGPANAGKTCLFKLIKGEKLPDIARTTQISSYFALPCEDEESDKFNINIWDIGGDKLMRNLAEIYIVNIDCAIIVFDLSNQESLDTALNLTIFSKKSKSKDDDIELDDDSNTRSWVESVHIKSPKATILVVGNKKDKKSIPDNLIKERLNSCLNRFKKTKFEYIEISCINNDENGIDELIERLKNICKEIKHRNFCPIIDEPIKKKKKKKNDKKKCLIQ